MRSTYGNSFAPIESIFSSCLHKVRFSLPFFSLLYNYGSFLRSFPSDNSFLTLGRNFFLQQTFSSSSSFYFLFSLSLFPFSLGDVFARRRRSFLLGLVRERSTKRVEERIELIKGPLRVIGSTLYSEIS